MKRLIKRITSASLAAALVFGSVASPIRANAAGGDSAMTDSPLELAKENMVGSNNSEGTFELTGITGIDTEGYFAIEVPEGSNKLLIKKDFFKTATGADIVLGENVEIEKPDPNGVIAGIDFANNNTIVGQEVFKETFKGFANLKSVDNFGLAINASTGSLISLENTFEDCTSLESIEISTTSQVSESLFNKTFIGCYNLTNVAIRNGKIKGAVSLFGNFDDVEAKNRTVIFDSCKFDEAGINDTFYDIYGTIKITNSTNSQNGGFKVSNLVTNADSDALDSLTLDFTGSKIESIDELIKGKFTSVTLNNIFSDETTFIGSIFEDTVTLESAPRITGKMPTALEELEHPFKGLSLNNKADEKSALSSFLEGLDLTTVTKYRALYLTDGSTTGTGNTYNYTDLSKLDLNPNEEAVYEDFPAGSYLPEYFITAKSFGGSYVLPFEAWKVNAGADNGTDTHTRVEADDNGVTIKVDTITNVKGFKYAPASLEDTTKYTSARATIKTIDVATGTTRTGHYGNENSVTGTREYVEDVQYFEDEDLTIPYDATDKKLVAGEILTLYYTSNPSQGEDESVDTKDITLNVVWVDEDKAGRPNEIKVNWLAETEAGDTEEGSVNIDSNKIDSTQTEAISVPTQIKGNPVTKYTITADLSGTDYSYETSVEDAENTIKLTLTKNASSEVDPPSDVEKEEEETKSLIENKPSNIVINYGKDTKAITATLSDGRTMPLVSDATQTTVKVERKDQTVYQKPSGLSSDKFIFFDISIEIKDGDQTHTVKSVDSPIGIAVEIPTDCDTTKQVKVYHYTNGIMTEPEEIRNASVTGTHIVIPTTSYSYYGIAYNTSSVEKRTITIDWDDAGYEADRPTSVVADWTATYADDSTLKGTVVFNRDINTNKQTQTFEVAKKNGNSTLVDVVSNVRAITGYEVKPKTGDALGWTIKWDGNIAQQINHPFRVDFSDAPADKRPSSYTFKVIGVYTDGHREEKSITLDIDTTGVALEVVSFPITRDGNKDSIHDYTTWEYPDVDGFTLSSTGTTAIFKYNGTVTEPVQTVYPITVKFNGDSADKSKRPTQVEITWTSTTKTSNTTTTGNETINLVKDVDTVTQNITIPNGTNEDRTVTITGPVINGYTMVVTGHTITYTLTQVEKVVNTEYTIRFEDNSNKAGRRPAELKITLTEVGNTTNTVTSTFKIPENVTTTVEKYTGTIPTTEGKTYSITKVEGAPEAYEVVLEGLTAKLKYKEETIDKTFKIVWEGDVEETRPQSVQLPIKVGEETLQTLVLSKDTNWAASAKLPKYVRGVEVSYQLTPPSITNYAGTANGDTITMKYTGTLTDAQKNAIEKTDEEKAAEEKEKEDIYNYEAFDWIDYANRYPDLKKAFGYNKEALYAHYIKYGIAEGRIATWTSKYANLNNDILAAYFPDDYKFKVQVEGNEGINEMLGNTNNTTNTDNTTTETESTVTVDENGNTVVKQDNGDGTVTETVIDKDGNVVQTKTYATGDNRLTAMSWVYIAMIITALGLITLSYSEFNKCNKAKKVIDDVIKS